MTGRKASSSGGGGEGRAGWALLEQRGPGESKEGRQQQGRRQGRRWRSAGVALLFRTPLVPNAIDEPAPVTRKRTPRGKCQPTPSTACVPPRCAGGRRLAHPAVVDVTRFCLTLVYTRLSRTVAVNCSQFPLVHEGLHWWVFSFGRFEFFGRSILGRNCCFSALRPVRGGWEYWF